MNKNLGALVAICVGASVGSVATSAAHADAAAEAAAGWIVVVAPHVEHQIVGKGGDVSDVATVTHRVEVADLDLTMYADVKVLEKRIADKAKIACEQLGILYPAARADTPGCVREAIAGATEQADRLIATANAKR